MSMIGAQDPCSSNLLMPDLEGGRRNPNKTTSQDQANLCDHKLDECL